MENLIQLRAVSKMYRQGAAQVQALAGISFDVNRGEFIAIMGKSGSGKSTLMNILGCLDTVTQGSYSIRSRDVDTLSETELADLRNREIGFIFQGFNLISSLTAIENVELPLRYRGLGRRGRRQLARQALERVGLGHRLEHCPGELSGGQQQRVAIARAIVAQPQILLADEPTGNLDQSSGKEVMEILCQLWHEGRTLILITHDPSIAAVAPRVVTITDGRITGDTAVLS